jgi:polygalacturonase
MSIGEDASTVEVINLSPKFVDQPQSNVPLTQTPNTHLAGVASQFSRIRHLALPPIEMKTIMPLKKLASLLVAALFAAAFTHNVSAATNTVFDVRDYGAIGDGKHLDSPAINQAIDACVQSGGGTVYVPAGIYLSGSIHLKSHIDLHLAAGAVILGAPQAMKAYDVAEPFEGQAYQDDGHTYFHNSLIWGENLTNVSITGTGMINGGGMTNADTPHDFGNKAVVLKSCRSVLIRDVTIFHGGHFAILVTGCDDMTVDNVTMDTQRDGIDIDCCRNTMVSNCRINSPGDDGLCPKSTYALGRRIITENLTIVNCQVSGFKEGTLLDGTMVPMTGYGRTGAHRGTGRIKFGTESSGGFRNVTIANCTFRSCKGLALEEVDGGIMENISINNLTMMDIWDYPIYITLGKRNRTPDATNSIMRNISIANVIASGVDAKSGIQITGMPGDDIEGVRLQNIRINYNGGGTTEQAAIVPPELGKSYPDPSRIGIVPAYGLFARHVKDLELQNIRVSFTTNDLRPAMICDDVDGLEIDDFKAQISTNVAPAKFDSIKNLVIRNSPALEQTIGKQEK